MKTEEGDVRINAERAYEWARRGWHILLILGALVWYLAAYKTALDNHLQTIDSNMQIEDRKLTWLIDHSVYPHDGQEQFNSPQIQNQSLPAKPGTLAPSLAEKVK